MTVPYELAFGGRTQHHPLSATAAKSASETETGVPSDVCCMLRRPFAAPPTAPVGAP